MKKAFSLTAAFTLTVNVVAGGDEPINKNPCKAKTYHGFLGIEGKVVESIAEFINKNY